MKRLFLSITLATLLGSSAIASDGYTPSVLNHFYKTFQNAQNVNWSELDGMLRIGFTSNLHQQFAYYSNDELIIVAREITVQELPETFRVQLTKYQDYTVTQVYELTRNNTKEYCIVIDSPSKQITLKGKDKLKPCFQLKH